MQSSSNIGCIDKYVCFKKPELQLEVSPDKQFYQLFYDIYKCVVGHITFVCRVCGGIRSSTAVNLHISFHFGVKLTNYSDMIVEKHGSTIISLNIITLFMYIPALCCLMEQINMEKILEDCLSQTDKPISLSNMNMRINYDSEIFPNMVKLLKQQNLFCTFCNMMFETFPSIYVITKHFIKHHPDLRSELAGSKIVQ